ncbi:unnamed protein product [Bursaphelenchus xylophilus]|uniref:(pine wood nematode) hypothetical protein n=1 Tax=Bursaphelenchus xylophilus TaxID=6326 RepID=A0A1I7RKH7_BURXY|nr:unnamed protein product [Bursaphelenchus xylophilus]CAG9131316.1 unnamed protein product [Bursaphelenchus xylophilus]
MAHYGFHKIDEEAENGDDEHSDGRVQPSQSFTNGFNFNFPKKKQIAKTFSRRIPKDNINDDVPEIVDVRPDDQELEFRRFIKYVAQCMDGLPVYDYQNDNHRLAVLGAKKAGAPYRMEPVMEELYHLQEERKLEELSDDDGFQTSNDTINKFTIEERFTNMIRPKISAPSFIAQSSTSSNLNGLSRTEKVRKHRSDPSLDNFNEFDDVEHLRSEDNGPKVSIVSSTLENNRKISCKTQRSTDSLSSMLNSLLHWRRKVVDLAAVVPLKRRKKKSITILEADIPKDIQRKSSDDTVSTGTGPSNGIEEKEDSQLRGLKLPEFVKVFEDFIHPTIEEDIEDMIMRERACSCHQHTFLPDAEPDVAPYAKEFDEEEGDVEVPVVDVPVMIAVVKPTFRDRINKLLNKPRKLLKARN